MDWTGQPDTFVVPSRTAEQRQRWAATNDEVRDALVSIVSEGQQRTVQQLLEQDVPHETPLTWMRDLEKLFQHDFAGAPLERFQPAALRLHAAITTLREQGESDADYFPSPVGQALRETFLRAMFHSRDSATLGHTVGPALREIVLPPLKVAMKDPAGFVIAPIARQRGTVAFETWAKRFRGTVCDLIEGAYRPMVGAFYRLSRLPVVDGIPAEVAQVGQLFDQARTHWPSGHPLSPLVDRRIAVFRNSEAHHHTILDLDAERFTFINRDPKHPGGGEKDRWSASPSELERMAIHVTHLAEVMQTFLLTVPFRSLSPDLLLGVLTDAFSAQPTYAGLTR